MIAKSLKLITSQVGSILISRLTGFSVFSVSPCLRGETVFGTFITTEALRTLRMHKDNLKLGY